MKRGTTGSGCRDTSDDGDDPSGITSHAGCMSSRQWPVILLLAASALVCVFTFSTSLIATSNTVAVEKAVWSNEGAKFALLKESRPRKPMASQRAHSLQNPDNGKRLERRHPLTKKMPAEHTKSDPGKTRQVETVYVDSPTGPDRPAWCPELPKAGESSSRNTSMPFTTYVLNMKKRKGLWMHMQRRMKAAGLTDVERMQGVDAAKLTVGSLKKYKILDPEYRNPLGTRNGIGWMGKSSPPCFSMADLGAAGNYMGIYCAYQHILQSLIKNGQEYALFVEDDVWFPQRFMQLLSESLRAVPKNWNIIYLGLSTEVYRSCFDPQLAFVRNLDYGSVQAHKQNIATCMKEIKKVGTSNVTNIYEFTNINRIYPWPLHFLGGNFALLLTKKFLQHWLQKALPIRKASDVFTLEMMLNTADLPPPLTMYPPLVSYYLKKSDIDGAHESLLAQIGTPDLECMLALHANKYDYSTLDCKSQSANRFIFPNGSYVTKPLDQRRYQYPGVGNERASKKLWESTYLSPSSLDDLASDTGKTWRVKIMRVGPAVDGAHSFWIASAATHNGWNVCPTDKPWDDEYTFYSNGTFVFDSKGVVWLTYEDSAPVCVSHRDLKQFEIPWGSGTHQFRTATNSDGKRTLTLIGKGAHIALTKVANDKKMTTKDDPVDSITYDIHEFHKSRIVLSIRSGEGVWWKIVLQEEDGRYDKHLYVPPNL